MTVCTGTVMCAQTAAGCVQQTFSGAVVYAAAAEVSTGHPDMRGDAGKLLEYLREKYMQFQLYTRHTYMIMLPMSISISGPGKSVLEEMLPCCVVGHTSDELTFHWADSQAVTLDDAISLPQLHVQGWFLEESLGTYRVGE